MKKIIISLFALLLFVTLNGCGVNEGALLQEYMDKVSVQTETTENFYLPCNVDRKEDHSITWESNNKEVIKVGNLANVEGVNYYVANVYRQAEDVDVVLKATIELVSGLTLSKDFNVKVIKAEKEEIKCITVAEALSNKLNTVVKVRGIVSGYHYGTYDNQPSIQGCYITDDTGTVYVYGYILAQSVKKGDDIAIEGTVAEYRTYKQLSEPTLLENYSNNNPISTKGAVTDKTLATISKDLKTDYTAKAYVFSNVTIKKNNGGSYINYVVDDKEGNSINLYSSGNSSEFSWLDEYIGKEVKILFAINSQNSKGNKWRGHVLDVIEVLGEWTETGGQPSTPGGSVETGNGGYTTSVEVGVAYKFGLYQANEKVMYYLTGEMSGYYGATATTFESGVDVYFEAVDGGYHIYYLKNNVKTYITITVNDTHYNITFAEASTVIWVFDATYNTVKCTIGEKEIYLGTYGNYKTFGGSDYSKIASSYPGRFYKEKPSGTVDTPNPENPSTPEGNAQASITFEDKAKRTSFSGEEQVWENNGIKIVNKVHESKNPVADYVDPARFYAYTSLTISYTQEFNTIVITTAGGKCYTGSETLVGATLTVSNGVMIITLDTPANTFTFEKLVSQIRASKIEIYTAD